MKYFLVLLLFIVSLVGASLLGFAAKPDWYDSSRTGSYNVVGDIHQLIEKKGKHKFFEKKLADFLRGYVTLDEEELNALIYTKLQMEEDGQRLLAVTDGVRAQIKNNNVELGAVLDVEKLQTLDAKTRRKVNKYLGKLPILKGQKIYLAVEGKPIARNGRLSIADDISFKVGNIPVSVNMLESIGIPVKVDKLRKESVRIRNINITDVRIDNQQIIASINPSL